MSVTKTNPFGNLGQLVALASLTLWYQSFFEYGNEGAMPISFKSELTRKVCVILTTLIVALSAIDIRRMACDCSCPGRNPAVGGFGGGLSLELFSVNCVYSVAEGFAVRLSESICAIAHS